ncbi:Ig-like domain-containing protein [Leifsonia aquatica]|uniref:Ig-like domain-containing protein n=1 Tax=Leifsonia aquatica TaxID=144185 RepID=UPI00381E7C83
MKKTIKKRAGRATVAGAALVGLTAAGLAFAAPASAAQGTGMVSGPLVSTTSATLPDSTARYLNSNGLSATAFTTATVPAAAPVWTYPTYGGVGPIISPSGQCLQANVIYKAPLVATCDDTVLAQTFNGVAKSVSGVNRLALQSAVNAGWYFQVNNTVPPVYINTSNYMYFDASLPVSTPVAVAPSLTTPLPGAPITPNTVFSGAGEQGTVITVTDKNGQQVGTATVGADKTWSLTLDPAPINGTHELTIVALGTDGKSVPLASGTYTMTESDEARAYTGPAAGATITPDTAFTGTGAKGETVVIKDGTGKVIGQTTVGQDGTWSTTLNPVPTNGSTDIVVEITGKNGVTEQLASETLTMTGSEEPNTYTGPKTGDTVAPDTAFTGTGTKGETVTITDDKGNVLGTTTVGQDGQWSLTLNPAPINGNHDLTVTIGDQTVANPSITMTGSDEAPAYSGPQSGDTITPDTVFTGTGGKGETVVITDSDGNVLGTTTVGNDGQWSLKLDPAPKNGDVNLIVTVGDKKVADTTVTMTGADEERALTSPAAGSPITPDTVFAGTGNIGDKVTIKDKDGNVLGSAEVGQDGTWSTTLSPVPNNGDTNLIIEVTGKDGTTEQLADNTYEMTESTTKFEVLTPDLSKDNGSIKNGTVFTGKGEPGTTVVLTDKDGNTIGSAEVDDQGNWSTPVTGMPQGPNNVTITHTTPGADPISTDLGAIVVVSEDEGTPLMDPAIAGGALLALLAAAGAFLGIRRRRITARQ